MLGSKVSTVGRTSHSGEPRSPHERIPTPVWREHEHVKQRERDLPHALILAVKAKQGGIQLQVLKKGLNRAHAHLGPRIGVQT
jgi:hypothetical protein